VPPSPRRRSCRRTTEPSRGTGSGGSSPAPRPGSRVRG
jgi:hypothetical protein